MSVASTPVGIDKDANVNDSDKAIPAQKETRRRFIFNFWPRDPKGEVIRPENSFFGKETPEKIQLWGATLNNFFYTHRIGSCEDGKPLRGSLTISTSSKLLGWMEKHGENYSIDDMDEARMEPDPEVIEPFNIGEIIREQEQVAVRHALDAALKGLPPRPALQNPRYPMPWPRLPFCSDNIAWPEPPMLEKLFPLSRLPKTLIVHDPWGTTDGEIQSRKNTWKLPSRGSKALRYRLQLSKAGEERAQRELDEAEKAKEEEDKILARFLADPHTRNTIPLNGFILTRDDVDVSPIFCLLSGAPTVDPTEPAHLRLSPSHHLGSGHHSVLYDAEFELPRDLLAERPICKPCIADAALRIWDEEDKTDSAHESANTESEKSLNIMSGSDIRQYMDRGYSSLIDGYDGPIRLVRADVDYFKPFDKPCKHYINMPEEIRYPPTATVRVAAKLSKRNDNHLDTEAKNYEAFPVHFFQHWSGLCIPPRHRHPVPVGAIAPQYYGYYVFDELVDDDDPIAEGPLTEKQSKALEEQENIEAAGNKKSKYYSPIMLLENCGKPIESTELSVDDREEAVSLFNRFHHAGWCHLSLFQRNIVMKPGPISASPKARLTNSKIRGGLGERWSFRLIDYGRSRVYNDEKHPRYDKSATENMRCEAEILWNWLNTDGHHPDH